MSIALLSGQHALRPTARQRTGKICSIIGNTVAWVLQDLGDGRGRLVVRTRGYGWLRASFRKIPLLREAGAVFDYAVGEPLHHYMEKACARGSPSARTE